MDDVLDLMDTLFEASADRWTATHGSAWWDDFYADRDRPVPFFADKPDENLAAYLDRGLLSTGRALDLGCGTGRNASFLASGGWDVEGVDLSPAAIAWAKERSSGLDRPPRFVVGDALRSGPAAPTGTFDLVHDSGCLHHLPPHRRVAYLDLINRVLRPGGHLVVVCFAAGQMGATTPDDELYLRGGLEGGLAFTIEELRWIFDDLELVESRPMIAQPDGSAVFGEPYLLTALFRRPGSAA